MSPSIKVDIVFVTKGDRNAETVNVMEMIKNIVFLEYLILFSQ